MKGCLSHQLYPGWLCCHQCFPGCAGQLHAAAGKLPATSSVQVSATGGSSPTSSQNVSLCQGCSLVHILGSVYQQGSWLTPWQLQQNRCQICNYSVYLAKEVAQPKHLCGSERDTATHSCARLTLAAQTLTTRPRSGMQKEAWPGCIYHPLQKQVAVGTSEEKTVTSIYMDT